MFKMEYASPEDLGPDYDMDPHGHIRINNGKVDWFAARAPTGEEHMGGRGPRHAPL